MLLYLRRNVMVDPGRAALSIVAVALAIALLLTLEGFRVGLYRQVTAYPDHLAAPLVAVQAGVTNLTGARSSLPASALRQTEAVLGVAEVHPVVGIPTIFTQGERKTPVYIIGYQDAGGPWKLKAGRHLAGSGEVVFDYSLARKSGLGLGRTVELLGQPFVIVGLSGETTSLLNPYIFISLSDAQELLARGQSRLARPAGAGSYSFLLLEPRPGIASSAAQEAVEEAIPAVDVFTPQELAERDAQLMADLLGRVVNLLVAVAYVAGILVLGLIIYAAVFEQLRDFGILKALGARSAQLYRYVVGQSLFYATAGFGVALFFSLGAAALVEWLAPQYLVIPWNPETLWRIAAAAVGMAALAALLPMRQVQGVDPALVFRQ